MAQYGAVGYFCNHALSMVLLAHRRRPTGNGRSGRRITRALSTAARKKSQQGRALMPTGISPRLRAAAPSSTSRKVVLQVENLVKTYGQRTVVDGVSFKVYEGEVVGLLGGNGAGKTTTFRMTCGLIPTDSGKIILNGLDVTRWPMHRRVQEGGLGYLPQDRSTFGTLTTEQNLYAAMEFLGYSRKAREVRCQELLEQFDLKAVRKTVVGHGGSGGLSGGERRRLEVARALLTNPKILLLDEPFANVDPKNISGFQTVIRNLKASGIAVLITDHQVEKTLDITDRSYVVDKGRVLCFGTREEVLSNPEACNAYFGENPSIRRVESANDATRLREDRAEQEDARYVRDSERAQYEDERYFQDSERAIPTRATDQPNATRIRERRTLAYRRNDENAPREREDERRAREEDSNADRSGLRLRRRGDDASPRSGRAKLDFKRRRNDWDE